MTRDELIQKLETLIGASDVEQAHYDADALLLKYINDADIAEAFSNIPKWYA